MPAHAPPSPTLQPAAKRAKPGSPEKDSPSAQPDGTDAAGSPSRDQLAAAAADGGSVTGGGGGGGKGGQSSNFRNVSACNRCRLRKNRCDQRLPSCASCEKAGVPCVGYDPITKREIPRSYVYYLETRVEQLEALLTANNISFPPADSLEYCSRGSNGPGSVKSPLESTRTGTLLSESMDSVVAHKRHAEGNNSVAGAGGDDDDDDDETGRLQKLVSRSGLSGVPDASNPRYLGSTSGVSFARVVFAAVQSSVSDQKSITSDKNPGASSANAMRPYKAIAGNASSASGTSMRDSFFGLHTKPTIHPAAFPDRALGYKLVTLYFEHANPQIPVLHRGNFMQMLERAYDPDPARRVRGPKELYMLNMVFAIGGGIILGDGGKMDDGATGRSKQCQPEEYHASAIVHLEACLSNSGGGLEELQAVLLLANFALLRPVPPGLWYIIGVAVRLAVDLGLYYEDGKDPETGLGEASGGGASTASSEQQLKERGRREFVRDMRRRLWWCTYSFDRLVSVCVGRPFGISDQVITTEFPSLLEDRYISPAGLVELAPGTPAPDEPTYKLVAHHYFRLRLLQSEILQVLQFQQAQAARAAGTGGGSRNPYMHTDMPSPFLSRHASFRAWRADIDRRLHEWKTSAPVRAQTGVQFSTEFLDLNYWQAIIMLYRQSLSVPAMFEGEYHTSQEVESPANVYSSSAGDRKRRRRLQREHDGGLDEDDEYDDGDEYDRLNGEGDAGDEDRVYLKVAEAGQRILRLYRQLHLIGLVNYTYLATHHLFMAGISYLYAIWHSPTVRSRLTMDEVDFTVLAATSVFTDLMDKCPPAEACRDAFDRTAKATVKMVNATGGFGQLLPTTTKAARSRNNAAAAIENRSQWSDWDQTGGGGTSTGTGNSMFTGARPAQPQQALSILETAQFEGSTPSTVYSHSNTSPLLQTFTRQALPPFRPEPPAASMVKAEPDGASLLGMAPRMQQQQARSDAGSSETAAASEATTAIDPSLFPLQQQQQQQRQIPVSPAPSELRGFLAPQQPQAGAVAALTPSNLSYADLQGIDFLQSLGAVGSSGGGVEGGDDTQMDLGFGLGWEGLHHDFSDGQQVDLFDGFFFGGQQGGAGGTGGVGM